ncbi:MAG TPA: prolyl oligopeptidase family serine peptidase [Gemmatimonadaceae bacterium]|nr:prolyl oligopeptidase family serine peptidase [Gemmatimonadaceae bacterium]
MRIHPLIATLIPAIAFAQTKAPSPSRSAPIRPITFLDRQFQREVGSPTPSPDGKWLLYTLSTPDWDQGKRQTDIYLVSVKEGVPSTKQMTFTKDKNETSPRWSRDGKFFVFLSNRDASSTTTGAATGSAGGNASSQNQIYVMRPDGGEARKITDAKEGVSTLAFSKDGKWLVYRSGKADEEQLYELPVAGIDSAKPVQLTHQQAGVGLWKWSPDSRRIYFVTADTLDKDEKLRMEKKFNVAIRNMVTPLSSLWALDLDTRKATRLTRDTAITVTNFNISDDGRWIGYHGTAANRYMRNVTEQDIYADLYLFETATGNIERLTNNSEVGETDLEFSPDSKWIAFSAPADLTQYSMSNQRVYLRRVDNRGGMFKQLGANFDGDVDIGFWSKDGRTIYFNEGIKATTQLMALDIDKNVVRQVSNARAALNVSQDDDSKLLLLNYADPRTPTTLFTVASLDQIPVRASWRQLTDANPQVRNFALGEEEEISWKSTDGKTVGGILIKPVGYQSGTRYPLIVAIHGGPAAADVLGFNGGYGAQTYAGAGYAVLMPNYRGSSNYGEKHKTDIVGNYFQKGYEDIMTGVDYLISQGIVDSTKMGVLGWSAGGHWSNWILTHTNRFKAISTGAGTSNWISMYAESDVQRNRQFYLGNKLPYDDFDAYWNQSPLKYIRNAKTPTMIHVVEGDPRVPRPQSEELFMALKRLGVPTELYVYPGSTHGIPDPRNQLLKSVAEMAWMDYWVRGSGKRFAWRDVLKTLDPEGSVATATSTSN